jgi:hypothetical protein
MHSFNIKLDNSSLLQSILFSLADTTTCGTSGQFKSIIYNFLGAVPKLTRNVLINNFKDEFTFKNQFYEKYSDLTTKFQS